MSQSHELLLNFHHRIAASEKASARANALFIYSKLVAGGMAVRDAKTAVEDLFSGGAASGTEDGYDAGYRQS